MTTGRDLGLTPPPRPGNWMVTENRDLRLRVEALEKAIRDADEAVRANESVGLTEYMYNSEADDDSLAVISGVLGEDEG